MGGGWPAGGWHYGDMTGFCTKASEGIHSGSFGASKCLDSPSGSSKGSSWHHLGWIGWSAPISGSLWNEGTLIRNQTFKCRLCCYRKESLSILIYSTEGEGVIFSCFSLSFTQDTNGYCRQWAAKAINVDNLADCQEMVMKIIDLESKPSTVKILIDMWHIQKLPRAQVSSEDDSHHSSDDTRVHIGWHSA